MRYNFLQIFHLNSAIKHLVNSNWSTKIEFLQPFVCFRSPHLRYERCWFWSNSSPAHWTRCSYFNWAILAQTNMSAGKANDLRNNGTIRSAIYIRQINGAYFENHLFRIVHTNDTFLWCGQVSWWPVFRFQDSLPSCSLQGFFHSSFFPLTLLFQIVSTNNYPR